MELLDRVRCRNLLLLAILSAPLAAQGTTAPAASCNTTNIRWVLPGNFSTAVQRAVAEQRMLLIKGISFGVDEAGATCATKGKW